MTPCGFRPASESSGVPLLGILITRGFSTTSSSVSASLSQVRTLSSSPFSLGTSNFALHFLQRAVRPPNSTGRRYFAPHAEQLHFMKSATTHLVPRPTLFAAAHYGAAGARITPRPLLTVLSNSAEWMIDKMNVDECEAKTRIQLAG